MQHSPTALASVHVKKFCCSFRNDFQNAQYFTYFCHFFQRYILFPDHLHICLLVCLVISALMCSMYFQAHSENPLITVVCSSLHVTGHYSYCVAFQYTPSSSLRFSSLSSNSVHLVKRLSLFVLKWGLKCSVLHVLLSFFFSTPHIVSKSSAYLLACLLGDKLSYVQCTSKPILRTP